MDTDFSSLLAKMKPLDIKMEKKQNKTQKDPRKHIDSYFGVRNNIRGNPIENKNYTLETLTYMTSRNRADEITNLIVDKMKLEKKKIPFGIFECCAGIGGNTLSFLDNPNISWVVSYEILPERRAMLTENIKMYDLAKNNRSFIPNEGFSGVPSKYKGVVLYMDPPWLPSHIAGHESVKEQYLLSGIKIADKTLEEWIASCSHCSMIVIRVPPGYKIGNVPGFKIEEKLIKNSLLIMAIPEFKRTLKIKEDKNEWRENLKNFLKNELLVKILPNEELREKMVSDDAMKIWEFVFTHETYNPNLGENYEEYEKLGDAVMAHNFIKYLMKRFPKIDKKEISEMKNFYLSKPEQARVSLSLGLQKYVRSGIKSTTHVFEDLLEALFGGLEEIGDKVFKFGAGNGLAFNLITYIFKNQKLDVAKVAKGNPKTQVKQILEKLFGKGVTAVEDVQEVGDGRVSVSISLPDEALVGFRRLGFNIVSPLLAMEEGNTPKVARNKAYPIALQTIRKYGITDKWIEEYRGKRDLQNPDLAPFIPAVQDRLRREGYSDFIFKKHTTKDGKYVQLIGVTPKGRYEILSMNVEPNISEVEAKRIALEKYVYDT